MNKKNKFIMWTVITLIAFTADELANFYNERILWAILLFVEAICGFMLGKTWIENHLSKF